MQGRYRAIGAIPDRATVIGSLIATFALGSAWWIIAFAFSCPACGFSPVATGAPGTLLAVVGIGAELSHTPAPHHIPPPVSGHWWLTAWSLTLAITVVSLATLVIGMHWRRSLVLRTALGTLLAALVALTVIASATAPASGQASGPPQLIISQASAGD